MIRDTKAFNEFLKRLNVDEEEKLDEFTMFYLKKITYARCNEQRRTIHIQNIRNPLNKAKTDRRRHP